MNTKLFFKNFTRKFSSDSYYNLESKIRNLEYDIRNLESKIEKNNNRRWIDAVCIIFTTMLFLNPRFTQIEQKTKIIENQKIEN